MGAKSNSWLPMCSASPRMASPGSAASRVKMAPASSIGTPNLFSFMPVEILAWVPASTSGLTRSTAVAVLPMAAARPASATPSSSSSMLKLADACLQRLAQFDQRLADARKDDVARRHPRRQRALHLAARDDVRAIAFARQHPEHGEIGIGLDGEGNVGARQARERVAEHTGVAFQRGT